ncbi:hypothetical protein [Shewanella benthica]|uniref:hypothetical protein n=1 Tax=Shewanella benthica TaxID=43661 RepID=UPI001E2E4168|nr:hypothetical protein [Shewanella benthica]
MLAPSSDVGEGQKYWGREVYSISNKHTSLIQLEQAAAQFSWEQIESRGGVYQVGGELSALWIFPLAKGESPPAILVINNISDWQSLLNEFQESMLGTLLFSFVRSFGHIGCLGACG